MEIENCEAWLREQAGRRAREARLAALALIGLGLVGGVLLFLLLLSIIFFLRLGLVLVDSNLTFSWTRGALGGTVGFCVFYFMLPRKRHPPELEATDSADTGELLMAVNPRNNWISLRVGDDDTGFGVRRAMGWVLFAIPASFLGAWQGLRAARVAASLDFAACAPVVLRLYADLERVTLKKLEEDLTGTDLKAVLPQLWYCPGIHFLATEPQGLKLTEPGRRELEVAGVPS